MRTILFVDGRNFIGKLEEVFETEQKPVPKWDTFNFSGLLSRVLENISIDEQRVCFAKLNEHPETLDKSKALIEERRLLKNHLEKPDSNI